MTWILEEHDSLSQSAVSIYIVLYVLEEDEGSEPVHPCSQPEPSLFRHTSLMKS